MRIFQTNFIKTVGAVLGTFLLSLVIIACSPRLLVAPSETPTDTAVPSPMPDPLLAKMAGTYFCMGHEYGLLAGFPDKFMLLPNAKFSEGEQAWMLSAATERNTFKIMQNPRFDRIRIYADNSFLLYLNKGVTLAHADGGILDCQKE